MNFQWTKQNVINDNIVNAETPNYKCKTLKKYNLLEFYFFPHCEMGTISPWVIRIQYISADCNGNF